MKVMKTEVFFGEMKLHEISYIRISPLHEKGVAYVAAVNEAEACKEFRCHMLGAYNEIQSLVVRLVTEPLVITD